MFIGLFNSFRKVVSPGIDSRNFSLSKAVHVTLFITVGGGMFLDQIVVSTNCFA